MNKEINLSCWHRLVLFRQHCTGWQGRVPVTSAVYVVLFCEGSPESLQGAESWNVLSWKRSPRIIEPSSWSAQDAPPIPPYA